MSTARRIFPGALLSIALLSAGVLIPAAAQAGSVAYTYDTLGRVTQVKYSNGVTITYTYDASGNRSSQVTTGAP